MNLTLLKEDDLTLQQVSAEWDFQVDGDPSDLVKEMSRLMFLHGGIGLAAPQCGVLKRIFIMGNPDELHKSKDHRVNRRAGWVFRRVFKFSKSLDAGY